MKQSKLFSVSPFSLVIGRLHSPPCCMVSFVKLQNSIWGPPYKGVQYFGGLYWGVYWGLYWGYMSSILFGATMVPNIESDDILLLGYSILYKEYNLTTFNYQKTLLICAARAIVASKTCISIRDQKTNILFALLSMPVLAKYRPWRAMPEVLHHRS